MYTRPRVSHSPHNYASFSLLQGLARFRSSTLSSYSPISSAGWSRWNIPSKPFCWTLFLKSQSKTPELIGQPYKYKFYNSVFDFQKLFLLIYQIWVRTSKGVPVRVTTSQILPVSPPRGCSRAQLGRRYWWVRYPSLTLEHGVTREVSTRRGTPVSRQTEHRNMTPVKLGHIYKIIVEFLPSPNRKDWKRKLRGTENTVKR